MRGHRIELLNDALSPLRATLPPKDFDRLAQALSLIYGVEVFTVLKDIWGLPITQSSEVAKWAACALVRSAIAEARTHSTAQNAI
jgi:hypothetical protein